MKRLFYIPAVFYAVLAMFADLVWEWFIWRAHWWRFLCDDYADRAEGRQ
jgi:hypothetical protein